MENLGVLFTFIGTISGVVLGFLLSRWATMLDTNETIKTDLHSLYVELEENLTFLSNVKHRADKSGSLELRPLSIDAYSKVKLSKAFMQIRGKLLSQLVIYFLKVQNFNQKVLSTDSINLALAFHIYIADLEAVVGKTLSLMGEHLIERKILKVKKIK